MPYFSVWLDDLTRGAPESGVSSAPWTKETLTVSPGGAVCPPRYILGKYSAAGRLRKMGGLSNEGA